MIFGTQQPTRSSKTRQAYEARYESLRRRFAKDLATSPTDLDPNEVVAQLVILKPELTMATWRQYKAAALHYIETHEPGYEYAAEQLRQENSAGLKPTSSRTSGKKLKQVPDKFFSSFKRQLKKRAERGHKHSLALAYVLRGTLLTGLRPNEWCYSEIGTHLGTDRKILKIRNSKHSNGRANGEYRELFIDELETDEIEIIEAALRYCQAANEDDAIRIQIALRNEYSETAKLCRHTLESDKSVTIYSFRHQFIANAKQTFSDPVLISAMVGHNSTKTAFEHYGRRLNGRNRIKVTPTPESVANVQKITLELYRDYVAQRKSASITLN